VDHPGKDTHFKESKVQKPLKGVLNKIINILQILQGVCKLLNTTAQQYSVAIT